MPFSVLIADDEKHICSLITYLIQESELDLYVIGTVNTGADAFEIIQKDNPQIVISDIRMPGYDGIELTRKTMDAGFQTKFILISGHRQFDYAHQAIQYGVVDYILKPIQKNALVAALNKAVQEIEEEQDGRKNQEVIKNLINQNSLHQCSRTLSDIAIGKLTYPVLRLGDLNSKFGLHFTSDVSLIAFNLSDPAVSTADPASIPESGSTLVEDKIGQEITRFFTEKGSEAVHFTAAGIFYILFSPLQDTKRLRVEYLLENCNQILKLFDMDPISFGVSSSVDSGEDLALLVKHANEAMLQSLLLGRGKVIPYIKMYDSTVFTFEMIDEETVVNFRKSMLELDFPKINYEISKIFYEIEKTDGLNATTVLHVVQLILEALNNAISALEPDNRIYLDKSHILTSIQKSQSIKEIRNRLNDSIETHMETLTLNRKQINVRPVQLAKQYIADHFAESAGLNEIAEKVHLNPAYLSVLFKKETGENFKDYVIQYRVQVAKEHLRQTNASIKDIAESVGYHDLKHFRAIFQKIVGLGPGQYRKLFKRMNLK